MERQTSDEIIHPEDFYDIYAMLHIPSTKHNSRIVWWGIIAGLWVFSVCILSVALVFDKISLYQLLLASVAVPLWIGVYLFFPTAVSKSFNQLWSAGIIGNANENTPKGITYQNMVTKLSQSIHSHWLNIIALFITVQFWLYQWYFLSKSAGGHSVPFSGNVHWTLFLSTSLYAFTFYLATLSLMRLVLVARTMYRIFHFFTIHVFPRHPDGYCGLGVMRPILWTSQAMFLAILCFVLSISTRTTNHIYALMLLTGYLIVFPAMLTVWLALPHREMVRTRNRHLQDIADEIDKTIQATAASIMEPTAAIIQGTDRLAALQKCYDQVKESFPTWPLWITTIKRLGFTLFLPLLTSLVPAILYLLTKLME